MISAPFFLILLITMVLYWILPWQRVRNNLLILASFVFLYNVDHHSIYVVLGLSCFTYFTGIMVARYRSIGAIHFIGVLCVLLLLVFFKYLGWLAHILANLAIFSTSLPLFDFEKLLLPLGISYITFKHISYLTDIKWKIVDPGRFDDFLLYSSLFTIFVAGPIERFERLKPQFESPRSRIDWNQIDGHVFLLIQGLFKKVVLAEGIASFIDPVLVSSRPHTVVTMLVVLLGYSFRIFYDFSGYSDIAVASSGLFGIRIMQNFDNPYMATNLSQFWRKWHISLSDWIRDYLFFPLASLRSGKTWNIVLVPIISMSICGIWHGPAAHYLLWGLMHGIGLSVYQVWSKQLRPGKNTRHTPKSRLRKILAILATFGYVTFTWSFFMGSWWPKLFNGLRSGMILSPVGITKRGMAYLLVTGAVTFFMIPLYNRLNSCLTGWKKGFLNFLLFMLMVELIITLGTGNTGFAYAGF